MKRTTPGASGITRGEEPCVDVPETWRRGAKASRVSLCQHAPAALGYKGARNRASVGRARGSHLHYWSSSRTSLRRQSNKRPKAEYQTHTHGAPDHASGTLLRVGTVHREALGDRLRPTSSGALPPGARPSGS